MKKRKKKKSVDSYCQSNKRSELTHKSSWFDLYRMNTDPPDQMVSDQNLGISALFIYRAAVVFILLSTCQKRSETEDYTVRLR
jgi:hypothetical protein